jgi:hypothetical protein
LAVNVGFKINVLSAHTLANVGAISRPGPKVPDYSTSVSAHKRRPTKTAINPIGQRAFMMIERMDQVAVSPQRRKKWE